MQERRWEASSVFCVGKTLFGINVGRASLRVLLKVCSRDDFPKVYGKKPVALAVNERNARYAGMLGREDGWSVCDRREGGER